jgi:hypothetical protein
MLILWVGIEVQCAPYCYPINNSNFNIGKTIMLNNELTIEELVQRVRVDADRKRDFIMPTTQASVYNGGTYIRLTDDSNNYDGYFSDNARRQLGTHLGIPSQYIEKLQARGMDELVDTNFNQLLHSPAKNATDRLFRTYDNGCASNMFRSIHSRSFLTFDYIDLMDGVAPVLNKIADKQELKFISSGLTDNKLYMKIAFPNMQLEVRSKQVNDIVECGVIISNSETGHGSIIVRQFIHRLVCLNGMTIDEAGTSRRHVGSANARGELDYQSDTMVAMKQALTKQLRDHVMDCVDEDKFKATVDKFNASAQDELDSSIEPEDAIESVGKRFSLSESEVKQAKRSLLEDGDYSRWGFANAITNIAHKSEDYDRATELQELGGNIINLNPKQWQRVALAA